MVTYSHSRLSTFEQCPLKFKFRYIDNLIPDIPQSIEGFLGNRVHDTLEWIYNEVAKNRTLELDEVIKFYVDAWNKEFVNEIKIVREDLNAEHYFNQGIKFLIDYFLNNSPFKDNTIATEKLIEVTLDSEGKYKLQGYVDRLVHNKDTNVFEIHDYKTSNTLKTQEELDKDRQLALYCIGIKNSYKDVKDVHLIWHYLAFNKKLISKRSDQQLEQLKKEIIQLIDKIESTKEFSPNPGCLCKWCEFQSNCPTINNNSNCKDPPDFE
jgi:putative RecB family exonuclease